MSNYEKKLAREHDAPDAWVSVEAVRRFQKEGLAEDVVLRREPGPGLLSGGYVPVYFGPPNNNTDSTQLELGVAA